MRVVLDTNVFLVSVSAKSQFRWIFDSVLNGKIHLCVSNEIIFEYREVISINAGIQIATNTLKLLEGAENVELVEAFYKWNLIKSDPDDNKFVDCAIAGNAKFIVSEDSHFRILKTISFPKVEVLTIEEFKKELDMES